MLENRWIPAGRWVLPLVALAPLLILGAAPAPAAGKALFGIIPVETNDVVAVSYVLPDTPAAAAGMRRGDVLVGLAGMQIKKAGDCFAATVSR